MNLLGLFGAGAVRPADGGTDPLVVRPDCIRFQPLGARRLGGLDLDFLRESKEAACVQVPVHLVTLAQGGGDCGISVWFQYPFTFWLPFTSVNNQKILLTASATMRMETN